MGDYVAINKNLWDERAPAHAASADYGFDRFLSDPGYLSGVVRLAWIHRRMSCVDRVVAGEVPSELG